MLHQILKLFSENKFHLSDEKQTQLEIQTAMIKAKIPHAREKHFDEKNIVDFFINGMKEGIAIEVKIKGGTKKIYKQCERYCSFDEVNCLILATNRSMNLPKTIHGKPCYIINLGIAWL